MNSGRFRSFLGRFTKLAERVGASPDEARLRAEGGALLTGLIEHDDWLPPACAEPHPQYYQQYLLHCDPLERFSVVSFVWGPGQQTPVHDHCVWGLLGVLRGAEVGNRYDEPVSGRPMHMHLPQRLARGDIDFVSPAAGDIHRVENAYADQVSISIHVYGANIGAVKRHVYDAANGTRKDFVSGYSNAAIPNVWDRSVDVRATLG
jgi:predicted metal-dependent enzyme (double-stranded beta helix superfamily)